MKTLIFMLILWPICSFGQILLPGDANNDGRVNHIDVLALGLNFGKEGPPRLPPFQGTNWMPKQFQFWPFNLPTTGINAAFSDCNGDGVVNNQDVFALEANYDSSQFLSQPPPMAYLPPDTFFTTAIPRLRFVFDRDTATVMDTIRLRIFYDHPPGLPANQAPLGVSFALEYTDTVGENSLVKDSLVRVLFEPTATDLLFAGAAFQFADARSLPRGRVEFGTAGKGVPALNHDRLLGEVEFIVVDVIVRSDTFFTKFKVDFLKGLMLNTQEQAFAFGVVMDDPVVVYQVLNAAMEPPGPLRVRCYPTIADDMLHIETQDTPMSMLWVCDAAGRIIKSEHVDQQNRVSMASENWPPGIYFVYIRATDGRQAVQRVIKR